MRRPMDSPVKPRCFFKIIVSNITPHSRLMIPRKFMTTYEDDLADCIFLKVPSGSVWQVKLGRNNSQVWLQNGWPDFAAHYSICFGHFLVFRYEGNSHFHVTILDKSATEVDYPSSSTCYSEKTYFSTGSGKRKEVTNDDVGRKEDYRKKIPLSAPYTKSVYGCAKASHQVNRKALQVTIEAEHARALASAKAFQSTNPFFIIKMCPSYVSGKFTLWIVVPHLKYCLLGKKSKENKTVPRKFATTYMTQDHCNVVLQLSDGRAWPLKCKIFRTGAQFNNGWRIFAQANSLAAGDVCVFELVNYSEKLVNVTIFSGNKRSKFLDSHEGSSEDN